MIPFDRFGPHHWQLLLILETLQVQQQPIDRSRLRSRNAPGGGWSGEMGTRLNDGEVLADHDDHDCLDDLRRAGLVYLFTPGHGYTLSDTGWLYAAQARRHVAYHGAVDSFRPDVVLRLCPAPLGPPARPVLADATLIRSDAQHVDVSIGGVYFCFRDMRDGWTLGTIQTHATGHALDEAWLEAAQGVAEQMLERAVAKASGQPDPAVETLRCPECKHLLSGPGLGRECGVSRGGITCGTHHVVRFNDGTAVAVTPEGVVALDES